MSRVVIGMDPHKRSATIAVCDERERALLRGRFGTDRDGYRALLAAGRGWAERVWAVEGCQGVGRHLAQRLVADGEPVLDVPAKLSARVRVLSTGQGRKTDATDAHSVAVAALRSSGLRAVGVEDVTVALRLLADRRDDLGVARTQTVNRLHVLLGELIEGGARRSLSVAQARALLATVDPREVVGRTRRQLAGEFVEELAGIEKKISAATTQLRDLIETTGSGLLDIHGIGPSGAARLLGDIGDVARFPSRGHFASWNGTAPIDASSGDHHRHRLSRAGNRRINRVLHIMAVVQLRTDTEGNAYYRRKLAAGKSPMEAIRALKRRLSDVVYRQLVSDAKRRRPAGQKTDPGGQAGAAADSRAVDSDPNIDTSEQSLPGTARPKATRPPAQAPDRFPPRSRRRTSTPTRSRRQAQSA